MRAANPIRAAVALAVVLAAGACDKESPTPAPPTAPAPTVPGATQVTGRERLAWEHEAGADGQYAFNAYVDGVAVGLSSATCVVEGGEARCSSPLPTMSDGVHTLEVSAVDSSSGFEGDRSTTLTLQKVTVRATTAASALPDANNDPTSSTGVVRTATAALGEVVARGIRMPAQLALLPDGRLLVAEADGGVRVVSHDASREPVVALEPGALLDPRPTGPLAIATAADFAVSRQVFIADLYVDGDNGVRARIVRMREIGDRLGEPATIFDAPVAADVSSGDGAAPAAGRGSHGPRLAFGADRLLYATLPPGLVFDRQPAASRPVPAIVRLTTDGRIPDAGAVAGITAHPLAFAWHPATGELLGLVADRTAGARVRALGAASGATEPTAAGLGRLRAELDGVAQLLRIDGSAARVALGAAAVAGVAGVADPAQWPRTVRLAFPTELADVVPGLTGRLTDVVTQDGVVYALVSDAPVQPGLDAPDGVIVRLHP